MLYRVSFAGLLLTVALAGCGDDGNKGTCDPANPDCAEGLVCEPLQNGQAQCFAPLLIRGEVTDGLDESAIDGALVQAADINGTAVGSADQTTADGRFELAVSAVRDTDGRPTGGTYTLRAQAAGYQPFPGGPRTALPLDAASAVETDGAWVIENAATGVRLLPLPGDSSGLGSISGQVVADRPAGVLVVAEDGGQGHIGYSGPDGTYTIFNLPPGSYQVRGYAAAVQLTPVETDLGAGEQKEGIDLLASENPLATVSGKVQIVNAAGGLATSVVLAVESTFVENAARGEVPPGLRAPAPGLAPDVNDAWQIQDVPDGRYVVLAAFENDQLVRDPDPTIAGTQLLHIEVAGADVDIQDGFKVTEALAVMWPGADGIETIETATPTFEWADDSGETRFELHVYDAFGQQVWADDNVPKFTGSGNPSLLYTGPPLQTGMVYQFRATSFDDSGPLSQTEDLKGVFVYQPGD